MIYDIFSFNNELDMLEIRLNVLAPYVDYFVIVEATETFSGVEKPLNFFNNKHLFNNFYDKIIYHVVKDTPKNFNDYNCDNECFTLALNSNNVTREHLCWLKEFYQKEHIKKALINLNDDDICYISDIDEIWDYRKVFTINDEIYKPKINKCYINYLNVRTNEDWTYFTGPIVTKYKNIKNECLNHLRTKDKMVNRYTYIEDCGWHFNALGGIEKKIDAFKHPVYTLQYMKNRELTSHIDESDLPEYIINNKEKYKKLFKND